MTDQQIQTYRLTVEIKRAKPLATGITAVEYALTLTVPYVEHSFSQLGEAIVGPRGCFLADRHRIPGLIDHDELEAAVFKAERKRRLDAVRESATAEVGQ